jgi:beta-phosphoglucomutase-like phosphatase (HAD superfamily)
MGAETSISISGDSDAQFERGLPLDSSASRFDTPRQRSPFLRDLAREGYHAACFDLDMTLVDSAPVYISLEIATCAHFGFNQPKAILDRHVELQARSGEEIMRGIYDLAGGAAALGCSIEDFNQHFMGLVKRWSQGSFELEIKPRAVEGARELVELVQPLFSRSLVATGSRSPVAQLLLRDSGMSDLFTHDRLYCSDLLPFKKHDPEYWPHVLQGQDPAKAVGFEDNPEAASWMLKAGFGRVAVRPWRHFAEIQDLCAQFPGRVQLVAGWQEIL